jgi:hypothetical protein
MVLTKEWWDLESNQFKMWVSRITRQELADGLYSGQTRALALSRRINCLSYTVQIDQCAELLLNDGIIPDNKEGDAYHMAFTICHEVDYLMTWNYAHLANPEMQKRVQEMCSRHAWRVPILVSPESVPRASMGHKIRRTDEEAG